MKSTTRTDVLILGGGPAGMTAALYLGRSRRGVVVLDENNPRHAVSSGVHNFLTREGVSPADLRTIAWEQMETYPTVSRAEATITSIKRHDDSWVATSRDGRTWEARAMLLAAGVIDEHPEITGYRERWGSSIHHCPYCHGWEMRDRRLAVLDQGSGEGGVHLARLLLGGWSDDVVVLTGGQTYAPEIIEEIETHGIPWCPKPITALEGPGDALSLIRFADGSTVAREGLFVRAPQHQISLVKTLGLELNEHGYVVVDHMQQTSQPWLWAAGDMTTGMQQVVESSAQGARAGAIINARFALG